VRESVLGWQLLSLSTQICVHAETVLRPLITLSSWYIRIHFIPSFPTGLGNAVSTWYTHSEKICTFGWSRTGDVVTRAFARRLPVGYATFTATQAMRLPV
jgi:hypothetical protein